MTIWIDAHLSPGIAAWVTRTFGLNALALRDVGLRDAEDLDIFAAAKAQGVILMTKDSDTKNHLANLWEYLGCATARNFEWVSARSTRTSTDR
jgi:predicted nuclease of predicted toxin-antitoxin system